MSLAIRLKQRRKELGLTQAALAETAGVSQQCVNRVESGLSSRPRYLIEFAKVLQCSPDWLLHGSQNDNKA